MNYPYDNHQQNDWSENMEFAFRPARPEDIPTAQAIAVRAWEPYFAYRREQLGETLFLVEHSDWQADKAGQIRSNLQGEHGCHAYVVTMGDEIVAFVTFVVDAAKGLSEIGNNAVDPDYQGRGIGTDQYGRVLEVFREQGMCFARVSTGLDPAHAPARAAYEKAGFTQFVPQVDYYQEL